MVLSDEERALLGDHEAAKRLTDEAVQMVMERMEALYGQEEAD